jgi:hypothetical protein
MENYSKKSMENAGGSLPLSEYEAAIGKTDMFLNDDITPVLLGLFGEVGSIQKNIEGRKKHTLVTKNLLRKNLVMHFGTLPQSVDDLICGYLTFLKLHLIVMI